MLRIVFFGTPEFAVPSLRALLESRHEVRAVVTQPDRPAGRGRRASPPPVKVAAEAGGVPVMQPARLRTEAFLEQLRETAPDLIVVVAYGKILRASVLELPPHGCINVHASLLPRYRGAAPIQWAVICGETETGVTTMQMDEGMDTGDMLVQRSLPVGPEETAGELHDRLAVLGAEVLIETCDRLCARTLEATPQEDAAATYAPMLEKADGRIDWQASAAAIHNRIRGLTPWPGAFTTVDGETLKIHRARVGASDPDRAHGAAPGTVLEATPAGWSVATGEGVLTVLELQRAGGRRMTVAEYLKGHRAPARLGT